MSDRIRPFSNGSEFDSWNRCDRCAKGYDKTARDWHCPLERAIGDAACNADGKMPLDLAIRAGWRKVTSKYGTYHAMGPCREFEEVRDV